MKQFRRLAAYLIMSVVFVVVGYGFIFIAARPIIDVLGAGVRILTLNDVPNFEQENVSLLNNEVAKVNVKEGADVLKASDIRFPKFGEEYGRVVAEKVDISQPLFYGDSEEILEKGAGHSTRSQYPGIKGTVLIGAHIQPEFNRLALLKEGDTFKIETHYGVFEYRVLSGQVIHKEDPEMIAKVQQRDKDLAMLYTCYPFTEVGNPPHRYLVIGEKISGPRITYGP